MKTEIIFLLDRSGSMSGLENDTIGGYNALIERQNQLEGQTIVTTVLFDHLYEVLWDGATAGKVKLTEKEYFVRGTTALLDAIGKTINDVKHRITNTIVREKPDKVLFVITTDGLENASKEYSYEKVKKMIQLQKERFGWEFIFLGANIDTTQEAESIGIEKEHAISFEATNAGVEAMFDSIHEELSIMRKR